MTARRVVVLLTVLVAIYAVFLLDIAQAAIGTGEPLGIGAGIGVVLLPVVACYLVYGELRFGRDTERLGRQLYDEGGLPASADLPRMPSGRIDPQAADQVFERRRAETQAAPQDWRTWYRLGLAYGDARDTARGRRAMRRAISLYRGR